MSYRIIHADVLDGLRTLADESVHMVVTSPPYWALRDYGTAKWEGGDPVCDHLQPYGPGSARRDTGRSSETFHGQPETELKQRPFTKECGKCGARRIDKQLGLEELHDCLGWATGQKCGECYICHMVAVFTEARRVLRKDGTCWINIGDSYAGSWGAQSRGNTTGEAKSTLQGTSPLSARQIAAAPAKNPGRNPSSFRRDRADAGGLRHKEAFALKPKDLCGMPWRLALALQADGWWLRDIIVWDKPAPMPESVRDRCTKSWEPILMLSKSKRYYFDQQAIAESGAQPDRVRNAEAFGGTNGASVRHGKQTELSGTVQTRNKRNLWRLPPMPTPDAHFATFPLELPETCLMAGTSERGVCPTCAAPWRRIVDRPTSGDWHADQEAKGKGVQRIGKNGTQHAQANQHRMNAKMAATRAAGQPHDQPFNAPVTLGWEPTCKHDTEPIAATILDPFCGAGTTILAALKNGRQAIGIELSAEYIAIAEKRIRRHMPLMAI